MTFNPPPKLLEKIMRFKALKYKEGKLLLHGIPVLLTLFYVNVYQQKLLEYLYGKKDASSIIYIIGNFQAHQGMEITNKRFGYAKKIEDKKRMLEFNSEQAEVVGLGKFRWIKMDFENNIFIMKGKSIFAEEYKKLFSLNQFPIDYYFRGCAAAGIEEVTGRKMLCIETKCIAQGHPYCLFVVKPIENWSKEILKEHGIKNLPKFKDLGAKPISLY